MDFIRVKAPDGTVIKFPAGTDDDTITKVMAENFPAQPPLVGSQNPMKDEARRLNTQWREQNPTTAYVSDVARNFVRGMPFGSFMDEAAAGIRSYARGTTYEQEKAAQDAMNEGADANSTKLGSLPVIGDVTAGGLTKLAGGLATAPFSPVARVMQGATLLPRAVNMGATGLGYGAAYGAGEGNTTGERLGNALLGGAVGGTLGAAAPVVGAGVSNTVNAVRSRLQAAPRTLRDFSRSAVNRTREIAQLDELTPDQVAIQSNQLGREGMLADMGENLRTATEAINQQPGPGRRIISERLRTRREAAQPRINEAVDRAFGPAADLPATIAATEQHYRQAARPLYDQFRQREIPVDDELVAILQAVPDDVWPRVQEKMRLGRIDPNSVANTGQGVDLIKRALDDAASAAQRAGRRDDVRLYSNLARDLRTHVDNLLSPGNPAQSPWAQGRAIAEEGFNVQDAIDEGRNAFNRNLSADQLRANMQGMSQLERESTRIGAREALRSQMANAGTAFRGNGDVKARQLLNAPEARAKAALLAETPDAALGLNRRIGAENTFAETYEQAMGNSATARREAARELIPRQYDSSNFGQLRQTSLSGFALEGVGRIANLLTGRYLNERNLRIASEMADMLTAQGVRRDNIARGLIEMANRANINAQQRQAINAFAENLVRGSTAPAIGGLTSP